MKIPEIVIAASGTVMLAASLVLILNACAPTRFDDPRATVVATIAASPIPLTGGDWILIDREPSPWSSNETIAIIEHKPTSTCYVAYGGRFEVSIAVVEPALCRIK